MKTKQGTSTIQRTLHGPDIFVVCNSPREPGCNPVQLWANRLNATGVNHSGAVARDPSGNFIAVGSLGTAQGGYPYNIWIRKYASDGITIWTRTFDSGFSESGSGIASDAQGNIVVTGQIVAPPGDVSNWIGKYNSNGTLLWSRTVPSQECGQPPTVAVDHNGNIAMVGTVGDHVSAPVIWLRKYDPQGTELWTKTTSSALQADCSTDGVGVAVDSQDNIVVAGNLSSPVFPRIDSDFWLTKYNSSGSVLWTRLVDSGVDHSGPAKDTTVGVAIDNNDNVSLAGNTGGADIDLFVRKYDSAGNVLWTKTQEDPRARAVVADAQGNVVVVGLKASQLWMTKYNAAGDEVWNRAINMGGFGSVGIGVALGFASSIVVSGEILQGGRDIFVNSYIP